MKLLQSKGYQGGKVRIAHCNNLPGAAALKDALLESFPQADIAISPTTCLCSYYAEDGGLMIGFET